MKKIKKSSYGKDLLKIKSEILCWGMRVSHDSMNYIKKICPHIFDEKFIHASHLVLADNVLVNPYISENFSSKSPYELRMEDEMLIVYKKDIPQCNCNIIPEPKWYNLKTRNGTKMSDMFRLHGHNTLADTKFVRCDFWNVKKGCLFCSFPKNTIDENLKLKLAKEVLSDVLKENENYSVALSDGARITPDKGVEYFVKLVKIIKKINETTPVSVELVPPDTNGHLDKLIDSGVDSIIMNLEFCDNDIRKVFCPGKSRISSERYFEAMEYGIERLGKGRVSSVLIAGIEQKDLTIKCATELTSIGVIPTIIPFKPYDNCYLKNFRQTCPRELREINERVAKLLKKESLNPILQKGCTDCGGCSMEIDYIL